MTPAAEPATNGIWLAQSPMPCLGQVGKLCSSNMQSAPTRMDRSAGGLGVFDHVRQRFLRDAVGGKLEAGGQFDPLATDHEFEFDARGPRVRDQPLELGECRLWRKRGGVVLVEQSEQPPHLGEGLPGAALRRQQALSRSGRVAVVEHPDCCYELEHDDADAVPDDVVQFVRDASAFGGDGGTSLRLPLPLQFVGLP